MSDTNNGVTKNQALKLFNTASQQKEPFQSADPGGKLARIYVCGVTPYDTSHVGHAMTALAFDTLHRYLQHIGFDVFHTQNLTDVDDDVIKRANRDGEKFDELGQRWNQVYLDSLKSLNCLPFDAYIPASSRIPEIINLVGQLVEKGFAYPASDGNVYFEAAKFPEYGKMSHLSEEEILEKSRAAAVDSLADDPNNPAKRDVRDFIVWQAARPGEPKWQSPWGEGRPGWHIECSAIGLTQYGPQFEVHGGGADLVFPHHSCEIAQSESVTGKQPFVKYWMHVGMVYYGGEKMSKSLGNLVLVRDILKNHSSDALRLYLLKTHYRTQLHYEDAGVAEAEAAVAVFKQALTSTSGAADFDAAGYVARFYAAMDDDLDTPQAVAVALELANAINSGKSNQAAQTALREMLGILGLPLAEQ